MTALTDILAKASAGAYGDDSELIGRVVGWAAAVKFDKGFGPFICGTLGKEGADGLHEGYLICPAYGADFNMTAGFMRDPKR